MIINKCTIINWHEKLGLSMERSLFYIFSIQGIYLNMLSVSSAWFVLKRDKALIRQVHYPKSLGSLESVHELSCSKAAHTEQKCFHSWKSSGRLMGQHVSKLIRSRNALTAPFSQVPDPARASLPRVRSCLPLESALLLVVSTSLSEPG